MKAAAAVVAKAAPRTAERSRVDAADRRGVVAADIGLETHKACYPLAT